MSGGNYHTLALKSDGTVWAWGNNAYGQIGDGTKTQRLVPVHVNGLSNIIAISAGGTSSYAVKSDGTVWAWGNNSSGQLGDGTTTSESVPVPITSLSGIMGISGSQNYCLALQPNGAVWAWGDNSYGELGNGTFNQSLTPTPALFGDGSIAVQIASGSAASGQSLTMQTDSTLRSWGRNNTYQLGRYGSNSSIPGHVTGF